jgi:hypothetical protein
VLASVLGLPASGLEVIEDDGTGTIVLEGATEPLTSGGDTVAGALEVGGDWLPVATGSTLDTALLVVTWLVIGARGVLAPALVPGAAPLAVPSPLEVGVDDELLLPTALQPLSSATPQSVSVAATDCVTIWLIARSQRAVQRSPRLRWGHMLKSGDEAGSPFACAPR